MFGKRRQETAADRLKQLPYAPTGDRERADWLVAFVAVARSILTIADREGLPIAGSIGFDATLLSDGTVIWHTYDIGDEDPDVWRLATREERITALLIAAERMPQLAALLPVRKAEAVECAECSGRGTTVMNVVFCSHCGGLGWVPPPN
jgi:hypothetical protein